MTLKQVIGALMGWMMILSLITAAMVIPALVMWAVGYPVEPWAVYLAIVFSSAMLAKEIWKSGI